MFYTHVVNRPKLEKLFVTVEKSTRLKVDMTGTRPQSMLKMRERWSHSHSSNLCEIVNSAMEKIKERKVFDASIRNEMAGFRFELEEISQEFSVLKTIHESLLRKGDAEKFYSNFYEDIAQMPPDTSKDSHEMQQHGNKGGRQYHRKK